MKEMKAQIANGNDAMFGSKFTVICLAVYRRVIFWLNGCSKMQVKFTFSQR